MAFISDTRTSGVTLAERFASFRANLVEANAKRKVYNQTIAQLSDLTDRDLADLGIHRSAIGAIATEAAYGSN